MPSVKWINIDSYNSSIFSKGYIKYFFQQYLNLFNTFFVQMMHMNEEQLNDYIYYITLMQKNSSQLLVGMDTVVADARS